MAVSLQWDSLLSYTFVTLSVILQTALLATRKGTSTAGDKSGLQVASSASVMIACSVRVLVVLLRPWTVLDLCLFEIPDLLAFLSAVVSLAAPATSAYALSVTASVLTCVMTALTWFFSVSRRLQ
jgi:hypothetical protein